MWDSQPSLAPSLCCRVFNLSRSGAWEEPAAANTPVPCWEVGVQLATARSQRAGTCDQLLPGGSWHGVGCAGAGCRTANPGPCGLSGRLQRALVPPVKPLLLGDPSNAPTGGKAAL